VGDVTKPTPLGVAKGASMTSSAAVQSTPDGPGSVSGAPNLPSGFTDTFSSRYVDAGDVRLHAVIGGDGPPLLLVHGWPESWYAWRMVMPALARDFRVVAVDQRGMGLSDKAADGYDTGTLATDLVALMEALGHRRFAVVGHDTGFAISYALASDHPDRVERAALLEIPRSPGTAPSPPVLVPGPLNDRLWHLTFNRLDTINEQLVTGREDIFYRWEFDAAAKKLPDEAIDYYVRGFSNPDSLRSNFGFYRALDTTIAQDAERKTRRLTMPVLAIGGAASFGDHVGEALRLVADDVQSLVIPDTGHSSPRSHPKSCSRPRRRSSPRTATNRPLPARWARPPSRHSRRTRRQRATARTAATMIAVASARSRPRSRRVRHAKKSNARAIAARSRVAALPRAPHPAARMSSTAARYARRPVCISLMTGIVSMSRSTLPSIGSVCSYQPYSCPSPVASRSSGSAIARQRSGSGHGLSSAQWPEQAVNSASSVGKCR
jgi:pimeloyl-ACP methyl ester carboxylesterase